MTGCKSKKAAAQDKVTDIDGHVVRDVRKPKKVAQDKLNDDALLIAYQSGYYDGKKAAQAKVEGPLHVVCQCDKCKAQPAQEPNWAWACNECGAQEFTSALCEADLDYLACSNCGGNEFHKEALEQPAQEPVAWWNDTGTHIDLNVSGRGTPLYTAPPQRTWVRLTDADIERIKLMTYEKETNADGEEQEAVNIDWLIKTTEHFCKEKNNG